MKLNNLQILRGLSALSVCCFHFRGYINFENFKLGEILFKNGGMGVPIFFIISGFIMTFTTQKLDFKKKTTKDILLLFYKRRIIRVVPLYYLLTFAWMILGGSFLVYFQGEYFARLIHSILFLPQKTPPVLYLGWSLNYEIFFYLIFGLSLLFKEKRYLFIIFFFIITYILGLLFKPANTYLQMVTSILNLNFVAGILLALFMTKVSIQRKSAKLISLIAIPLFITIYFGILKIENELILLLTTTLLVSSFLLFDYTFHFKGNKVLIFLGDISYSLYLSHPFVEILFRKFKVEGYFNIPYFIFKIFVVIAVASLLYYFVEKKVTEYLKLKLKA